MLKVYIYITLVLLSIVGCGGGGGDTSTFVPPTVEESSETNVTTPNKEKIELEITPVSRKEAIKLLRQASFTSYEKDIAFIEQNGANIWIEKQLNTIGDLDNKSDDKYGFLESMTRFLNKHDPATYPTTLFNDPFSSYPETQESNRWRIFERSIWWQKALHNEDQLRQRVAYALSQVLVLSKADSGHLNDRGEAAAHYYDILLEHAFGNYGDLLKKVSMNASMADYLTFLASSKADEKLGTAADENYARELMQLFSIGLYELNNDGTKKLNAKGLPIAIYTQEDVSQMARVFTGWALSSNNYEITYKEDGRKVMNRNNIYKDTHNYVHSFILPIRSFNNGEYHDYGEKKILNETIPAGLTPKEDIYKAIDILMENPNIAPHICRELINRLVTSNPTAQYMSRVVSVFNDNGSGEKGDLKATVRAILTDVEARENSSLVSYGKVDEYVVLTTHYLSSLHVKPLPVIYYQNKGDSTFTEIENRYWLTFDTQYFHQLPFCQ